MLKSIFCYCDNLRRDHVRVYCDSEGNQHYRFLASEACYKSVSFRMLRVCGGGPNYVEVELISLQEPF